MSKKFNVLVEIPKVKERPIQGHVCLLVCSKSIRKDQRDSRNRKMQFQVVRDSQFWRERKEFKTHSHKTNTLHPCLINSLPFSVSKCAYCF